AKDFIDTGAAVRTCEHFVAFSEIAATVEQLDLFVSRQCDGNWFIQFISPNPFRAVRDKSLVTVVAFLQLFLSILTLRDVVRDADGNLSRFRTQNTDHHSGEYEN